MGGINGIVKVYVQDSFLDMLYKFIYNKEYTEKKIKKLIIVIDK